MLNENALFMVSTDQGATWETHIVVIQDGRRFATPLSGGIVLPISITDINWIRKLSAGEAVVASLGREWVKIKLP